MSKTLKLNRKTVNRYCNEFRQNVSEQSFEEHRREFGDLELDKSYFGARRIRAKQRRGAAGKTPVFGLLKRNRKVFVTVVPNCSREELMPIIRGKILEESTIHTDGWKAYDGLILDGYTHYRIYHRENEFACGKSHVNDIECFWGYAKRRISKFSGLIDKDFILYLKESECRYNHRFDDFANYIRQIFFDKFLMV